MYNTNHHNIDISNHSFLITGGAGFIGAHIAEYLLKWGAGKVRVLDNYLTGDKANLSPFMSLPNFELIEGDIRDLETCRNACKGIDFVTHQAALGSVPRSLKEPQNTNAHNVDGFLNVLIAAKDEGVKRFVYASSSSVYGDSPELPKVEGKIGKQLSPYAVSKYTNELYADVFYKNFGIEVIGLRYFNVFGPRQKPDGPYAAVIPLFVDKLMNTDTVYIDGDGEQTRDFTFVENAVQANIKAFFTANDNAINQVFNVAVGENFSVNYLFDKIKNYLEINADAQYREARKGDVRNSLADISKAQELLGFNPEVRFLDGLEQTVEYFKSLSVTNK